jgi:outer membrane protein
LKKAEEAINSVAKENKFSYIFDASAGTLLYAQDSDDVMPMVKTKLGLK